MRARVDVHDRAREHPQLAHPVERRHRNRSEAHREVDQKEREYRHQAQRQQVEDPVFPDARVDGSALFFEAAPDEIAQHVAGHDKGDGGTNGGGEGNQDDAPEQTKYRPGRERQNGCAGYRCAGDEDVDREKRRSKQDRARILLLDQPLLMLVQLFQRQETAQIEGKPGDDRDRDQRTNENRLRAHAASPTAR